MYVCMYVYMYVCLFVLDLSICMYVCMYVYLCMLKLKTLNIYILFLLQTFHHCYVLGGCVCPWAVLGRGGLGKVRARWHSGGECAEKAVFTATGDHGDRHHQGGQEDRHLQQQLWSLRSV